MPSKTRGSKTSARRRRAQVARLNENIVDHGVAEAQIIADEVLELGRRLFKDQLGPLTFYPTGSSSGPPSRSYGEGRRPSRASPGEVALAADRLAFDDSPAGEHPRRYELASGRGLAATRHIAQARLRPDPTCPWSVLRCQRSVVRSPLPVARLKRSRSRKRRTQARRCW